MQCFSFSQFYYSQSLPFLEKNEAKQTFLTFKQDIAFLKKKDEYRKNVLFEYNKVRKEVFHQTVRSLNLSHLISINDVMSMEHEPRGSNKNFLNY